MPFYQTRALAPVGSFNSTVRTMPLLFRNLFSPGLFAVLPASEGNALFAENYNSKWENENDLEARVVTGDAIRLSATKNEH